MTIAQTGEPAPRLPLRLWPGVVAVTLQWLVRFGAPVVATEALIFAMIGGLVCALAVLVWWAFFSRVPHFERWGALVLMIAAVAATPRILHPSIVGGMMGMMFWFSVIPGLCLALVAWAVISRSLTDVPRRAALVAAILLACGAWALARTDGITGAGNSQLAWRWTKTAEERLLAQASFKPTAIPPTPAAAKTPEERPLAPAADKPAAIPPTPATAKTSGERVVARAGVKPAPTPEPATAATKTGADWPGFRGPHRNGVIPGVRIETDWSASPPVQLWRRPIGPGWSSFAVLGDLFYTQEQRGSDEVVTCYNLTTGEPVWTHTDPARFYESNGGAGPRATPTLANGRAYTFGATGIVNALDARDGAVVWSRNAASDTGTKIPGWGFTSSPLVVDDVVIVAASGRLIGYDLATGNQRWLAPSRGGGYSSPHLLTLDGVAQVLLMNGDGAISVAPADGTLLWEHKWPSGSAIVQPALASESGVLVSNIDTTGGVGTRLLAIAHGPNGWTNEERWTSVGLKPYFNDFVVHNGHAFGFDSSILACIDLKDGKRNWKGGRYGHGQLVLFPDQDVLLVLSEEGELALVAAAADQFKELARFKAIEGKTWNHPALAGDVLLVRNGEEMAAFRLSLARH